MSQSRNNALTPGGHAVLADRVFDGHKWHAKAAALIRDGRIVGVGSWGEIPQDWPQVRLAAGALLAPGFIDLQVNGGGGVLLNERPTVDGMRAIASAHRRYGTTACLPTLITDTHEQVRRAIAAVRSLAGRDGVLGLHLEGPFISPQRPGVHRPDWDRQPRRGRPRGIVRTRQSRHVVDYPRARMRAGRFCASAGLSRRAHFHWP